jgi:chaperonin GroES
MKIKTSFTLLHDLVMILPSAKVQETAGGLVLPVSIDATAPAEGVVLAVGPGKVDKKGDLVPLPLKQGDKVIYIKNQGKELKQGGDTLIIIPVADVLCKIS